MNNDEIRAFVASAGIAVNNVTQEQFDDLHSRLKKHLKDSGCFRGSFRMRGNKGSRFMTCKADYFENREAVSFNGDGFIGMAGWADSKNILPIRTAVIEWANAHKCRG